MQTQNIMQGFGLWMNWLGDGILGSNRAKVIMCTLR
ncbi:uncharacterized protein METZ01_LOCUS324323, partial [marine metagenome]